MALTALICPVDRTDVQSCWLFVCWALSYDSCAQCYGTWKSPQPCCGWRSCMCLARLSSAASAKTQPVAKLNAAREWGAKDRYTIHWIPVCGFRPLLCFRKPARVEVQKKNFFPGTFSFSLDCVAPSQTNETSSRSQEGVLLLFQQQQHSERARRNRS